LFSHIGGRILQARKRMLPGSLAITNAAIAALLAACCVSIFRV
jgi:hypothetical protein